MRKPLLAFATVLLACVLFLSSGVVALADAASPPADRAGLFASGKLPPVNAKGFIAPISPRDPKATPISTVAQLRAMVTGGNYYLTQDIDLSSYNGGIWQPLMASVTLDGQGHVLRNLRIPASAKMRAAGLFGAMLLYDDLSIKNLGIQLHADGITGYNALADGVITEYPVFIGGLVGVADSQGTDYTITFSNCYVKGDVTGTASGANQSVLAGGLVGEIVGSAPISIVDCYTTGRVRSTSDRENSSIGGLVGRLASFSNESNVTVDHTYSTCDVSATNGDDVIYGVEIGGLIGSIKRGTITNSHATGAINANASNVNIGGLVGACDDTGITHCSSSGNISAATPGSAGSGICIVAAGGLVGVARGSKIPTSIVSCYSTSTVDAIATNNNPAGISTSARAGGIAGELQSSTISDCYATGATNAAAAGVTGNYANAGGVAGTMSNNGTVTNCYATGLVTATQTVGETSESGFTGGIAGGTYKSSTISKCYYDNQTTGQTQAVGNDGAAGADAGKTTEQMKDQATYPDWDFASVWSIQSERNNGYPHLQWQNARRVFFDSQGGSAVAWQSVKDGASAAEPAQPTRAGYTFAGWYKEPACTNPWSFTSNRVTTDLTLYAKWVSTTPTGVKALSASYSSIKVSWNAVLKAAGYQVYRATSSTGTYTLVGTVTGTSFTNTGLTAGTTYYYKVRSYAGSTIIYSAYSSVVSAKPVPVAPTSPKAAAASYNSIKVTWAAVSGATKYEVYRATSSAGAYSLLTTTSYLYYTNTSVNTGTTYYYKVRAYRLVGSTKVYGAFSAVASAKTTLGTPGSMKATPVTYNSIKVTWGAVSGATKYEVYRSTSSTGTYALLTTTSYLYYTNTSVNTGTTYYYKVRAYRLVGSTKVYGAFSSVVSAKTAIGTPGSVKAAPVTYNSIKVTWGAVTGASGYAVYRATSSTGTYASVGTTTSTSFTNTSTGTGITYYYEVKAYRTVGSTKVYGSYSAAATAKTAIGTPTTIKAARISSTGIKVSWSAVAGATQYEVWRSTSSGGTYTLVTTTTSLYSSNGSLTTGKTYYYKVRAYHLEGSTKVYGAFSTVVSAKP